MLGERNGLTGGDNGGVSGELFAVVTGADAIDSGAGTSVAFG